MDNSISYQPTQLNLKPDFGSIFILSIVKYRPLFIMFQVKWYVV